MNECMEIDNPLITIVMAVYEPNMQWLKEQLLSLEAQTYPNLELIIRDDCSPTVPFEQICECAATCIRSFPYEISRNERNVGSNQTFEWLTQQARGEYIAYCDQDDVWLPEKIAHSVEAVKRAEAQSPNVPIALFGDARVVDDSLQQLHPSFQQMSGYHTDALDVAHLLMENKLIGCTMLFNRALRDKLTDTVPDGLRMHDWWIALIASAFGRIIYLDEPLLLYRQHTGNVVGGSSRSHYITNRVKHLTAQRQVLYDTCKQAEVFLTIYNDQLTETQKRLVSLFAGLPSANWFTRRYLILRYHFLKSGLLRNLGVLLII